MDPDGSILGQILLLLALILASAFFTMSEMAIITLNDAKLRKMADTGHKKAALVLRLIESPSRFFATIQLGVTLSGLLASALAANTFSLRLAYALRDVPISFGVVRVISVVVVTLVLGAFVLVLGDMVPKRIAMQHYEGIAFAVARPLYVLSRLERPLVWLLSSAAGGILRLLRIDPDHNPGEVTEEEIRMMIDASEESGHIEESDRAMLNNIFEFDDRTADEMMTHRTEMVALERDAPLREVIDTAVESGYSRIPIYQRDLDSITGILYVKDLLALVLSNPDAPFSLEDYIREPLYVLESTNGKTLLTEFQEKKIQMAVVVDEYGGTSGLVTMEDLLEAIVGNIQDEYDDEEEDISPVDENSFLVDGLADLDETARFFGIELEEEDEDEFETVGGYVVNLLGYIPGEGEHPSVVAGPVRFTVREMDERRIAKLVVERLPLEAPAEQEAR